MDKKAVWIVGVLVLLSVIAAGWFVFGQNRQKPTKSTEIIDVKGNGEDKKLDGKLGDCESNANPVFTADITDLSKVVYITPPVTVQSGDLKTHGYLHMSEKASVYVPADAVLYEGAFYKEEGKGQYSLFFRVSCEVTFMFDHILEPIDEIVAAFPKEPAADSRTKNPKEKISFKAGDLIGTRAGTISGDTWDFGVYNLTKTNPYRDAKYEVSDSPRYKNAVCPFEYFGAKQKAEYKKLMKDSYGKPYSSKTNLCSD
jgi:hypothetical protein